MAYENSSVNNDQGSSLAADAVKGIVAGTVAVWLMDRVTWPLYNREDPVAHAREKEAQKEGKYVAQYAATRLARMAGRELTDREEWNYGQGIHYILGIGPAVAYSVLRHQYPAITAGRGLAYGLGLFAVMDEVAAPAMGLASGPTRYPWQAHARGLAGHLVVGLAIDAVLGVMDRFLPPQSTSSRPSPRRHRQEEVAPLATVG